MSRTVACESGAHELCIRPSCSCWCEHPHHLVTPRIVVHDRDVSRETSRRADQASAKRAEGALTSCPAHPDPPRITGRRPLVLDVDAIVRDYLAGDTLDMLASDHGCSRDTIQQRLEDAGVKRRPTGTRSRRTIPRRRLESTSG